MVAAGETACKYETKTRIPTERVRSSKVFTRQHSTQLPTASLDEKYDVRISMRDGIAGVLWSR